MSKEQTKKLQGVGIYTKNQITKRVYIPFTSIGSNVKEILEEKLKNELEGKCIEEGFVKPNSLRVTLYSGSILESDNVYFDVVAECLLCTPVEGMSFKVTVKNITKAGIRGAVGDQSPVDVFIARDHYYSNKYFNSIKVDDTITVKVIGVRYEINDTSISVLADIIQPKKVIKKPKLILKE